MDQRILGNIQAVSLAGQVDIYETTPPFVAALESRDAFAVGLRMGGLSDMDVNEALFMRDETRRQLDVIYEEIASYYPPDRRSSFEFDPIPKELWVREQSAWEHLKDWFSQQKVNVLETTELEVRAPLFILNCADIEGYPSFFHQRKMKKILEHG